MRIILDRGVLLSICGRKIHFDGNKGDFNFLSHAHTDHVFSSGANVICSDETLKLAQLRVRSRIKRFEKEDAKFEMIDAGHVLGSRALLVKEDKNVLYTGDFCLRDRHFMEGFKPPKADALIMETTFGAPEYVFPDFKETVKQAQDLVDDLLRRGRQVALIGYALGKAQQLTKLAEKFDSVCADESVKKINDVYIEHGIKLKDLPMFSKDRCVDILITHSVKNVPKKFFRIGFSGWAVNPDYKYRRGLDEAFIMSDHSDFYDLLRVVKKVSPEKVYTMHDSSEGFASFLRFEGFEAMSLRKNQQTLYNYH